MAGGQDEQSTNFRVQRVYASCHTALQDASRVARLRCVLAPAAPRVAETSQRPGCLPGWASRYVGGITPPSNTLQSMQSMFVRSHSVMYETSFHKLCGYR